MKNKQMFRPALVTAGLLLIPLLGQWPWGVMDFVIMGALIMGTGVLVEYALTKVKNANQRLVVVLAILAAFFVVWAQLAVGLINKGVWGLECLADRGLGQFSNCVNDSREIGSP